MNNTDYIINLCDRWLTKDILLSYSNQRILIGSYTCANYFIYLLNFLKNENINLSSFDLVIPVFPEHKLDFLKTDKVNNIIKNATKIVINDFGILDMFNHDSIRLGRLIFKDYRDQRYKEYDDKECIVKVNALLDTLKSIGYDIREIELDIISKKMIVNIDKNIKVYVHYPYRQISCSHICEFASVSKKIENKFKPDDDCLYDCRNIKIEIMNPHYIKISKNIYEELDESYLDNIEDFCFKIITPRW